MIGLVTPAHTNALPGRVPGSHPASLRVQIRMRGCPEPTDSKAHSPVGSVKWARARTACSLPTSCRAERSRARFSGRMRRPLPAQADSTERPSHPSPPHSLTVPPAHMMRMAGKAPGWPHSCRSTRWQQTEALR